MGYMAFDYIKVIISWLLWNFGDEEMFKKFCVKQMDDSTSSGRQNTRILAARRELPKVTFPGLCIRGFFGHLATSFFSRCTKSPVFLSFNPCFHDMHECDLILLGWN